MILPGAVNLTAIQGATFTWTFTYSSGPSGSPLPVDLSGYSAKMQVRDPDLIVELSSDDGSITLGADGTIVLFLDPAAVSALPLGCFNYDLRLTAGSTDGDVVFFLVKGSFEVQDRVTL